MKARQYAITLALGLSLGGWGRGPLFAMEKPAISSTPAVGESHPPVPVPEPVVGLGYHAGNFIGPLAFDVIIRPLAHVAVDLQAGYSREAGGRGTLGFAPHLQWEFWRGLRTPYLGLAFRYEKVWWEGTTAESRGGCLNGGWQMRWRSGFGLLFGAGLLYKTPVDLRTARGIQYYSQGGLFGTYEIGVRYFF